MKKLFDEEEDEYSDLDKKKILVTIIPFVLIIVILAATLLASSIKKESKDASDLQQSIMEYADAHGEAGTPAKQEEKSTPGQEGEMEDLDEMNEEESIPSAAPSTVPSVAPEQGVMEEKKIDFSKSSYDKDAQLKEMMAYWEDNNQKALDDLANLERFMAMSWSLRGTDNCYYYGDTDENGKPNGKGIAVYADNQYYYGDWKDGVRSGNGTWMHYHLHQAKNTTDLYTYHQYTGGWENDLPSGEGSEHYDYNTELLKVGVGYDTNLIGSYSKGLVHGKFYLTNIYSDGSSKEWNAEAEHGSWIYQNENKDKKGNRTVYVDVKDPENYIWMRPEDNVNIGVSCLISKNKN